MMKFAMIMFLAFLFEICCTSFVISLNKGYVLIPVVIVGHMHFIGMFYKHWMIEAENFWKRLYYTAASAIGAMSGAIITILYMR